MKKHLLFSYFYASLFCANILSMESVLCIEDAFRQISIASNSLETILNASEACVRAHAILFPTDQNRSFEEQVAAYIVSNPAMIPSLGNKMYRIVLDNKEEMLLPIKDLIDTYHENTLGLRRVKIKKSTVHPLLQNGANPNYTGDAHTTPLLHDVCYFGHLEVAKLLLEYGAKINAVDNYGKTALFQAVNTLRYNLNTCQDRKKTSLRNEQNERKLLCLLLSHGIDVNKKNKYGNVALEEACFENNDRTVPFLIHNRAKATISCLRSTSKRDIYMLCRKNLLPEEEEKDNREELWYSRNRAAITGVTGALLGYTTTFFTSPESLASYLIFVSLLPDPLQMLSAYVKKRQ